MDKQNDNESLQDLLDASLPSLPDLDMDSWLDSLRDEDFSNSNACHKLPAPPPNVRNPFSTRTLHENGPIGIPVTKSRPENSGRAASAAMALAKAAQRASAMISPQESDLRIPSFSPYAISSPEGYPTVGSYRGDPMACKPKFMTAEKSNFPIFSKSTTIRSTGITGLAPGSNSSNSKEHGDSSALESNMIDQIKQWESTNLSSLTKTREPKKRQSGGSSRAPALDSFQLNLKRNLTVGESPESPDVAATQKQENPAAEKRQKVALTHNLSERRRRDRINERLKLLQDLIPNSSRSDKVSILDEVIEYIHTVQLQLKVMSMRSGMSVDAFFPGNAPSQLTKSTSSALTRIPIMGPSPWPGMGPGAMGIAPIGYPNLPSAAPPPCVGIPAMATGSELAFNHSSLSRGGGLADSRYRHRSLTDMNPVAYYMSIQQPTVCPTAQQDVSLQRNVIHGSYDDFVDLQRDSEHLHGSVRRDTEH